MSNLNQAFISAYSRQSARSDAITAEEADPVEPAVEVVRQAAHTEGVLPIPGPHVHLPSVLVAAAAATHARDESTVVEYIRAEVGNPDTTPTDRVHPPPEDRPSAEPSTAAADKTVRADAAEEASMPQPHFDPTAADVAPEVEAFRPLWELDCFIWPELVERLLTDDPKRLDDICECLTAAAKRGVASVAITSYATGEGCTTLACCLARRLAEVGRRVVLVDGNFDDPQLVRRLGVSVQSGWEDVLSGRARPDEVAVLSVEDHLTLLPLRQRVETQLSTTQTKLVGSTFEQLAVCSDLVLLDVGPVGNAPGQNSTLGSLRRIDAAIVVRDLRSATSEQVASVVDRLAGEGIETLGIAENFGATDTDRLANRAA